MAVFSLVIVVIFALMFTDLTISGLAKSYPTTPYTGIVAILLWIVVALLTDGIFFYA